MARSQAAKSKNSRPLAREGHEGESFDDLPTRADLTNISLQRSFSSRSMGFVDRSAVHISKRRRSDKVAQPKRGKKLTNSILNILPVEIFIEILGYAHPRDLLVFTRVNKTCRRLLMQSSSIRLWKRVLQSVPGLPECPAHLIEPQYVALVFTKYCTVCGASTACRVDAELSVRLCVSCRRTHIEELDNFSRDIKGYLPSSGLIGPQKSFRNQDSRDHVDRYCFLDEARKLEGEWYDLKTNKDKLAVEEWEINQTESLKTRTQHAIALYKFLTESERDEKSLELVNQRRAFIEAKLSDRWDLDDYRDISPLCRILWMTHVEQPRLITDATWKTLRPKLDFIVNESSDQVFEERLWTRQLICSLRLTNLLFGLGRLLPSALEPIATRLQVKPLPASVLIARIWDEVLLTAFPNLGDALKWPCMKNFINAEYDQQGTQDRFVARLDEIQSEARRWDKQVAADLTSLLQKGQKAEPVEGGVPLTVHGSAHPTQHLTDDMRLLLRADCVFKVTKHHTLYDVFHDTSRNGVSIPLFYPDLLLTRREEAWDPTYFEPHREARKVARRLLQSLGMEHAAHVQLKFIGSRFICGWCSDASPKEWIGIIKHFLEEQCRKPPLNPQTSDAFNYHLRGLDQELDEPTVLIASSKAELVDTSNLSRLLYRKPPVSFGHWDRS